MLSEKDRLETLRGKQELFILFFSINGCIFDKLNLVE